MTGPTEHPSNDSKQELVREIMNSFDRFTRKVKQGMRKFPPISPELADGHIFVLAMLQQGTRKASDLADSLGITSGAVTGLTDKLANMRLIERERSEEDRRVVLLSITEEGREFFGRIRQMRVKRICTLIGQLEDEDLQQLLNVFEKLNDALDK